MNTQEKITTIKNRLTESFTPTHLEVIDDSDQHVGHAGHGGGGRHFTVIITSKVFDDESRVAAHRKIYAIFDDLIPDQIHALRIKIILSS